MGKHSFKIISLLCMSIIFSVLLDAYAWANTSDKPVVIRKTIAADVQAQKESGQNKNKTDDINAGRHTAPRYDPRGKIDPFEPLIKETPKIKTESATYADADQKGTTALEDIDLSQLRLTGIILAGSGNRALVREASGRGHVISTGTPIGTHGGRVASVLKDKVIVKEKMKDPKGRIFFQETELKLNKPNI